MPTSIEQGSARGDDTAAAGSLALTLRGVSRSFPGVRALADVDLDIAPGTIHALVGENGAGKSTLMAIASGALAPDEGEVTIGGSPLAVADPAEARRLGLGIVRQDLALLPHLTVAENFALGTGTGARGGIVQARQGARDALAPWRMPIEPDARIEDLNVEQQTVVEIAKALALDPRVLILDEPTEHLNRAEVELLFDIVRQRAAAGCAIVYISHRIREVKEIAKVVSVLRDGRVRGTYDAAEVDEQQIVELVVGRSLETVFPPKAGDLADAAVRLQVEQLDSAVLDGVDLQVRAGEIVGIAGVQGNGQTELIRALAGLGDASGSIRVDGRAVPCGNARALAAAGVAYIPADRKGEGLFLPMTVAENLALGSLSRFAGAGMVRTRAVAAHAADRIAGAGIKAPSGQTPVGSLSGGNQQKVVLARALDAAPGVLLAEEPTQGVDAGARVDIYRTLRDAAADGAAVVILSSDGVELEGLCDRVIIMSRGQRVAELSGAEVTERAIAHAALTANTQARRDRDPGAEVARRSRWRDWLRGDHAPAVALGIVVTVLAAAIGAINPAYFSAFSIGNILFAASIVIFVGCAQQVVVLGGGFDLSVGPLMSMLVVVGSFFLGDGGAVVIGLVLVLVIAGTVGAVNGLLVTGLALSPVVVTLAVSLALQGTVFLLRGTPGGSFAPWLSSLVMAKVGPFPVVFLVAAALALFLQWALRRTRWGAQLRAVGSRRDTAARLGIRVGIVQVLSYVLTALLVVPAALVMMAQIGVGDGRPGLAFTLTSVTAVVLAGTDIFGGRGSFLAIVVAGVLVAQVLAAPTFLGLSGAWGYWLPGLITVAAAVLFARMRAVRRA